MAKISLSNQERFAVYVHLNGITTQTHAEGRRFDRVWSKLNLDEIVSQVRRGSTTDMQYDPDNKTEYELTSDERDSFIDYMDRPMNGGMRRVLVKIGDELIRSRDG